MSQLTSPYLIQYNTKKHSLLLSFTAPIDFGNADHVVEMIKRVSATAAETLAQQGIEDTNWDSIAVQDTVTQHVRTYWMN